MRLYLSRSRFSRRPVRNTLIGVCVLGAIGIAAVGAVVGLVLLAAGALVHFGVRAIRGVASPGLRNANGPTVIDGEYQVVRAAAPRLLGSR